MSLREYGRKRDFSRTAEPPGRKAGTTEQKFVVQKHDATRLHYDFRLQMDGVLKSWAVPKGFPFESGERHLAVHVEDHPVEYGGFEGIIPKGQYGGGTVMLWDRGDYEMFSDVPPLKALKEGKLHMRLRGEKLKGEWTLIRTRIEAGKEQWLLLKTGGGVKPISEKRDDTSVISGRAMRKIAEEQTAVWQSDRPPKEKTTPIAKKAKPAAARDSRTRRKEKEGGERPRYVSPMKAALIDKLPSGGLEHWAWEIKWDGYRAIAIKDGDHIQIMSRNERSLAADFPEVVEALRKMKADRVVLDGEIVALEEKGRSSFQLLQARDTDAKRPPIYFYAFDLLHVEGRDLTPERLDVRKAALKRLLGKGTGTLRYSASLEGDPAELLKQVEAMGLEGLIGKRRDRHYEVGLRTGAWVKLKCAYAQEFVIGGYTPPQGSRQHFGALLVGVWENKKLLFAGRVGTGFDHKTLAALHKEMVPLRKEVCPFADLPQKKQGRWSQGITAAEMRKCTWLSPKLVCQVRFGEWTRDASLRHPVFLGLRRDKDASEVVREVPPS